MKTTTAPISEAFTITDVKGLDPILVILQDLTKPGDTTHSGSITVECWGKAWSTYFGAMPWPTMRAFAANCEPDYLMNKLWRSGERRVHRDEEYLLKIVRAVQEAIKPLAARMQEWSYSWNEEDYHGRCDSPEAAIAEAVDNYASQEGEPTGVFVAEIDPFVIDGPAAADHMLEFLTEQCHDHCGEAAESWEPNLNKDLIARIGAAVERAVEQLDPPRVYGVDNKTVRRHEFTPDELRDARGEA